MKSESSPLPYCFLQTESVAFTVDSIHSQEDSAGIDGDFLYGGLLDRCQTYTEQSTAYEQLQQVLTVLDTSRSNTSNVISSKAYKLCLCKGSGRKCTRAMNLEVFRGQLFSVSLLAVAQGGTPTSTQVITHKSWLRTFQNSQFLPAGCSKLMYSLYSAQEAEQLILYPDDPYRDSGLAKVEILVNFLPIR